VQGVHTLTHTHTQEVVAVREAVGAGSTHTHTHTHTHTQEVVAVREAVGAGSTHTHTYTHTGSGCSEGGSGCRKYTHRSWL